MSQPVWKYLGNLGDRHPIEYGGLFVYKDTTGVYGFEMEKLEEPCDDDTCEECEDEPVEYHNIKLELERELGEWDRAHQEASYDEYKRVETEIYAKHDALSLIAQEKFREAHEAWQKHVDEHERWTVYRVCLERFKIVREYDCDECTCEDQSRVFETDVGWKEHVKVCPARKVSRYMVGIAYEESWRKHGTPAQRKPWFFDSLDSIASTRGTTKYALIKALCSNDWRKLAFAWQCILDHHGWDNGDGYPITLSLTDVKKRYKKELSCKST